MVQHVTLELRREQAQECVAFWALLGFERIDPPPSLADRAACGRADGPAAGLRSRIANGLGIANGHPWLVKGPQGKLRGLQSSEAVWACASTHSGPALRPARASSSSVMSRRS